MVDINTYEMARINFITAFSSCFIFPFLICAQFVNEVDQNKLFIGGENTFAQLEDREVYQFQVPDSIEALEELLDKRDMTSKHFKKSDGEMTALLAAGPLHYYEEGKWKDINHKITKNNLPNFPYANTTNLLMTFLERH